MARVLFVYEDACLASKGATIVGSPSADSDFPASNVLNPDRKVRWRSAANPGGSVDLIIDLGAAYDSAQVLAGFGVLYALTAAPFGTGMGVTVYSSATSSAGPWTTQGTLSGSATYWYGGVRDWVEACASPAAGYRYWRFNFTPSSYQFSVGKLFVGTAKDLGGATALGGDGSGFLYSPGSGYEVLLPGTTSRTMDGDPIDLPMGDARKVYRFSYQSISSQRAVIEAVAKQTRPLAIVDPDGYSAHVVVRRDAPTRFTHGFGNSPGLWSAGDLVLEQIP